MLYDRRLGCYAVVILSLRIHYGLVQEGWISPLLTSPLSQPFLDSLTV
jgi:hypothetical protein